MSNIKKYAEWYKEYQEWKTEGIEPVEAFWTEKTLTMFNLLGRMSEKRAKLHIARKGD